jgi:hypothetical protein
MGEHDQTVLTGRHTGGDAHEDIRDDGRTLIHPEFEPGAGAGAGDDVYNDTPVYRYSHDKLIPDTVHVHIRPFTVTKWESIFSTVFGTGTRPDWLSPESAPGLGPSFTPVIDESYRVVGHLGWISATEIRVPKNTVESDSPVAHIFEEARLGGDRQRLLSMHDRDPFPAFPARRERAEPDTPFWASVRRGQLRDASEELRFQNNLNYFLAGGGDALVGRDYVYDEMARQNYVSFLPGDYRCMVLVRPDGYIQNILRVEKIPHQSRRDRILGIIFEVVDIVLTVWMIIDIATISVGLLRLGVMLASRVEIRAIELAVDRGAKAALELAEREAKAVPKVIGKMAGTDVAADAFWTAGEVAPRQFTKAEEQAWTAKIADRMKKLGIPKENIGIRGIPGESGEAFTAKGSSRGANVRGRGISVHGNVEKDWVGFPEWNAASVDTRIDASIAHEWMEFNELTHWETVQLATESKLRISEEAKQLLAAMQKRGRGLDALIDKTRPP